MMTKMFFEGADYAEVLKEAQDKGYAERNPEADVEGHDACRKIAILTSLISGQHVDFEKIHTEGITKITTEDMKYAKETEYGDQAPCFKQTCGRYVQCTGCTDASFRRAPAL